MGPATRTETKAEPTAEAALGSWTSALAAGAYAPGEGAAAAMMAALGGALIARAAGCGPDGASPGLLRELRGTAQEGEMLRRHALAAADRDGVAARELATALRAPAPADEVAAAAIHAAHSVVALLELVAVAAPALRLLRTDADPRVGADVTGAAAAYAGCGRLALALLRSDAAIAGDHGASAEEVARLRSSAARLGKLLGELDEIAGGSAITVEQKPRR